MHTNAYVRPSKNTSESAPKCIRFFAATSGFLLVPGRFLASRHPPGQCTGRMHSTEKNAINRMQYNRLKLTHSNEGAEAYWRAKDSFLRKILSSRKDGETA